MPKDKIELDVNEKNEQEMQFSWTDLTDDSHKMKDKDWEEAADLFKRDQILNYDFAYIEKQKMAAKEKGEFIYKEAIATLTKPEPSPFRFFSWLKHKFARREAENRLYEIMAKKEALDEQQKDLDERRKNLQEKGNKIIEEKPNPQEEKSNPQEKSADGDMDYKEWKGGRGFDVINPSQAMAKANDEKALSDFKNGVLEKAKADLQMQVKEYERSLNEVQLGLDEELKSFTKLKPEKNEEDSKKFEEIKERALRIRADEEELKTQTEAYEASQKQFKADQKRLKNLPKLMKENEEKLKKRSEEYEEEKESYDIGMRIQEQEQKRLQEMTEQLKEIETQNDDWVVMDGSKSKIALLNEVMKAEENLKKLEDTLKQKGAKMTEHLAAVQDLKAIKRDLAEEQTELQQNVKDYPQKLEEQKKAKQEAEKEVQKNKDLFKKKYENFGRWNDAVRLGKQKLEKLEEKGKTIEKDVLNARVDHALLKSGRLSVRCVAVNGKIYPDPADLAKKHLPPNVEFDPQEAQRLKSTQSLLNFLQNKPVMKFLNSDNLAEYMTYDEKKGEFALFDGKPADKLKNQVYQGELYAKYFGNDMMYQHNLIEKDPKQYLLNTVGSLLAKSWSDTVDSIVSKANSAIDALKHPVDTLEKLAEDKIKEKVEEKIKEIPVVGAVAVKAYKEAEKLGDDPSNDEIVMAGLKTMPTAISSSMKAIFEKEPTIFKNTAMTDAFADCSLFQAAQKMGILEDKGFSIKSSELVGAAVDLIKNVKIIAENVNKSDEQCKKAQEELARGHERFARAMQAAMATTDRDTASKIISTSANIAQLTFEAATGCTGKLVSWAFEGAAKGIDMIYNYAAKKKEEKSLINSDSVLKGIDVAAGTLKEEDVKQVFREFSGIRSLTRMADMVKIVDAIDMHRTLKKNPEHKSVPGMLKALGFKPGEIKKITVSDILKKISGDGGDYHERIRNAIEDTVNTNPTGIKRWFKTLFGRIKNRILGTRKGHIENTFDKQHEILVDKLGKEDTKLTYAARLLYKAYEKQMNDKNGKVIKGVQNENHLIGLFALTKTAQEVFNVENLSRESIGIKPEKMKTLLSNAVREVNGMVEKVKTQNQNEKQVKNPNKVPQQEPTGWVLG